MAAYIKVANADDLQPGQAKLVEAETSGSRSSTLTGPAMPSAIPAPIAAGLCRKAPSRTMW